MIKVLHVTNVFPDCCLPDYGIFIRDQISSLDNTQRCKNDVYYINVKRSGRIIYLRSIKKIRMLGNNYEVIHAHHLFSAIVCILAGKRKKLVVSFLGGKFDMVGRLSFLGPVVFF